MTYRVLILLAFLTQLHAQPAFNTSVPSPKQILGYELGDRFTSHAGIERYITAVRDAVPDRVQLIAYGETYEGRALYLVIISSPENINRLDEIRSGIRKLSDPRTLTDAEAERLIKSTPPVAWLSYGVHGNEASCPEAALNVIYQLASRTDTEATSILHNSVVIIDPLLNPDGHERYVNYEVARAGAHPIEDKDAVEHNEDWPSGRTNHYFFDLNRDWAWLTQKESRARVKAYREWKPQVHVDFHEMGYNSSYFFFPAFKPINKNFPKSTTEWGTIYGKANAAAFDKQGWSYWSGESFDLFYPGYGDSWPSLNGAIGMTYEQAGQVGVRVRRSDETILTLRDRLEHHSTTSLATLKATAEHREKRLRDFYNFFKEALQEGKNGSAKAFVVDPQQDPARAAKMISVLRQEGVEVDRSPTRFTLDAVSTYFVKGTTTKTFSAGSYIIPLEQPAKRLIMALMEQEPALSDTFFYDISTWTLPIAYDVETYWTGKSISTPTERVNDVQLPAGSIVGGKAGYAYLFRWETNDAVRALAWLLQNNSRVTVAMKEFMIGSEKFPRGTIIVPVGTNGPDIHSIMQNLVQKFNLTAYSAQSGMTDSGINLGSDRAVRLKRPRIIVATGSPVSTEAFGSIWSMFDRSYDIEFIPMKLAQLRNADLHDYTAIVFPDDNANGQGYKSQLDSNAVQKLKAWVAGGGTFVGIEGGAAFASASVGKLASVKLKEKKKDDKDTKKDTTKGKLSDEELEKRMTVEERERKARLESIPGTMLRVKLDNSHPLGFGYDGDLAVLKTTQTMFELTDHGYNVGMYTKSPRLSGYMSKENEKMIEDTPFLVHEQLGSGNIILFADDPNFRLFLEGLNKVFLNSILLMPSIRNVTLTADEE
ncbi:MAG: hypothetical protein HY033_12680 [Ignavibacteriae bacterium]|nr:hypothetical protein [Ignavibacteria bacterium]MBI3365749.1 hypothetical protein [Ignavibacteriota bacterium]